MRGLSLSFAAPAGWGRWSPENAAARNMLLLTQLRWLAVLGQFVTIVVIYFIVHISLPIVPMFAVLAGLVVLNLVTLLFLRRRCVTNLELFLALLLDVLALTIELHLSGGATNPFVSLYLLQVVLGAVLLETWSSWVLVGLTSAAFAVLAMTSSPLDLPPRFASTLSPAYIFGGWFNFLLTAVLLVLFVTRVAANLRARDAHLAEIRQRAAEEEHIIRMGLLASGAAHELGTPLASLSVILGDWKQEPALMREPRLAADIADMQVEVRRCKEILSGILFAAGEVTGEAPERTTLCTFLAGIVDDWSRGRPPGMLRFDDRLDTDISIVGDRALAQTVVNLLDNAVEASASAITLTAQCVEASLVIAVRDNGTGFPPHMLAALGKPYQTSKSRRGAGLGLFLAVNVLRTLGGTVRADNLPEGGAEVRLSLPVAALALEDADG